MVSRARFGRLRSVSCVMRRSRHAAFLLSNGTGRMTERSETGMFVFIFLSTIFLSATSLPFNEPKSHQTESPADDRCRGGLDPQNEAIDSGPDAHQRHLLTGADGTGFDRACKRNR